MSELARTLLSLSPSPHHLFLISISATSPAQSQSHSPLLLLHRGRYKSQGTFSKYVHEGEDGYDTVEWIVAQPWCNGRVGCFGLSYCAHVQISLACLAPRGLSCLFIESGGFWDAFTDGVRRNGVFTMKQVTWAFKNAKVSQKSAPPSLSLSPLLFAYLLYLSTYRSARRWRSILKASNKWKQSTSRNGFKSCHGKKEHRLYP